MNRQDANARFAHIHALIAEDDALIALDMEQTLCAHFGFRATVVHSVSQGLAVLSERRPTSRFLISIWGEKASSRSPARSWAPACPCCSSAGIALIRLMISTHP